MSDRDVLDGLIYLIAHGRAIAVRDGDDLRYYSTSNAPAWAWAQALPADVAIALLRARQAALVIGKVPVH